ncbi:Uncharacterised protein [uncultured archaeon]|nr:Uncharacterised protein [uncultured archaeon]
MQTCKHGYLPFLAVLAIATALLLAGCPQQGGAAPSRDYFIEVHMEPAYANSTMFDALTRLVGLADSRGIRLTLLFTPQWAEMISADANKSALLAKWNSEGHEIGAHHHGALSGCGGWDGYTDLDPNGDEFKSLMNSVPCPSFEIKRQYIGNMSSYMAVMSKIGNIHTMTTNTADFDWPEGVLYSGGGQYLEEALSLPTKVAYNGHTVYKLSSAPLLGARPAMMPATQKLITLQDLEAKYVSSKPGAFGVVMHVHDYADNPDQYAQLFDFLRSQKNGTSKTISQMAGNHQD